MRRLPVAEYSNYAFLYQRNNHEMGLGSTELTVCDGPELKLH